MTSSFWDCCGVSSSRNKFGMTKAVQDNRLRCFRLTKCARRPPTPPKSAHGRWLFRGHDGPCRRRSFGVGRRRQGLTRDGRYESHGHVAMRLPESPKRSTPRLADNASRAHRSSLGQARRDRRRCFRADAVHHPTSPLAPRYHVRAG